jgi:hypothetical protein
VPIFLHVVYSCEGVTFVYIQTMRSKSGCIWFAYKQMWLLHKSILREGILAHYRAQKESTTPNTGTQFPFLSEVHKHKPNCLQCCPCLILLTYLYRPIEKQYHSQSHSADPILTTLQKLILYTALEEFYNLSTQYKCNIDNYNVY